MHLVPVSCGNGITREVKTSHNHRHESLERIYMSIYNVETMSDEEIRIRATVGKWGNSAALRLPATLISQANLATQQPVDLVLSGGRIILEPVTDQGSKLAELLAQVTPESLHGEIDFGLPVGRELL